MDSEAPKFDVEMLLDQMSWLRRFVRQLVNDADSADELAQDVCAQVLRSGPKNGSNFRAWLAQVARRTASAQRQRNRPTLAFSDEMASLSTRKIEEQADLQRHLVGLILDLREPYRSTLLLHFFRGLSLATIARQQSLPASTVRNRLARGLNQIRQRLDQEYKGRRTWAFALLPFAQETKKTVSALLAISVSLAMIALGVCAWDFGRPDPDESLEQRVPFQMPAENAGKPSHQPVSGTRSKRQLVPLGKSENSNTLKLRGLVIDCDDEPVAGVRILLRRKGQHDIDVGIANEQGQFVVSAPGQYGDLVVAGERYMTLMSASLLAAERLGVDPVIVVTKHRPLTGRVLNEARLPIAGAAIRIELPIHIRTLVSRILDASQNESWQVQSDFEGRFEFARVPIVGGMELNCEARGYLPLIESIARNEQILNLEVANQPLGKPAPKAVILSQIKRGKPKSSAKIQIGSGEGIEPRIPSERQVKLSTRQGLIRDQFGNPRPNVIVRVFPPPVKPREFRSPATPVVDGNSVNKLSFAAQKLPTCQTDENGRFELRSFWEKGCRLQLLDRESLECSDRVFESTPPAIIDMCLDRGPDDQVIAGQIVDDRGLPMAGISVRPVKPIQIAPDTALMVNGNEVRTDELGRFSFAKVQRAGVRLVVKNPNLLPKTVELDRDSGERIEVDQLVHIRAVVGAVGFADELVLCDRRGELVKVVEFAAFRRTTTLGEIHLHQGRSAVLRVPRKSSMAILKRLGVEIARHPIQLEIGKLNVLNF